MNSTEIENTYVNQSEYWNNNSFSVCEFMDANFTRQYIAAINTPAAFILWTFLRIWVCRKSTDNNCVMGVHDINIYFADSSGSIGYRYSANEVVYATYL